MPFIQQAISPVNLSRPNTSSERYRDRGDSGDDFDYIVNYTLSNVLRQLASVLAVADGIFHDLNHELTSIRDRSNKVKQQIEDVDKALEEYDLEVLHDRDRLSIDLLSIKKSYAPKRTISTGLFTKETRSINLNKLYAAATLQVPNMKETYDMQICTPVLGQCRRRIKKHIDEEIDTRMPETVRDLRKWTSAEAIGDVTVRPHCISMLDYSNLQRSTACNDSLYASISTSYIDGIDVTIVNDEVDFNDDAPLDHTLPSPEEQCETIAKKYPGDFVRVDTSRGRFERMALIRRTIGAIPSGTQKSLHDRFPTVKIRTKPKRAVGKRRNTISGIESTDLKDDPDAIAFDRGALTRQTTDFSIRSSLRFTQLKALKQWGKHRLKLSSRDSKTDLENEKHTTPAKSSSQERSSKQKKKTADKLLKQNPLYLSSKSTFGNYFLPENNVFNGAEANQVKLREPVSSRRCRRSNMRSQRIEEINSSSGNWSASSESGRTSASSENTVHPKALLSEGSAQFKRKVIDSSTPSRSTNGDLNRNGDIYLTNRDLYDDENSSIYSCDTEGYFTSFHLDSGLKTMRNDADCEYGLFGKSTMSKSDIDEPLIVDLDYELAKFKRQLKHDSRQASNELDSPFPNHSDMAQEARIREKTMIDSSRIPSMSEITPLNSDEDEQIVLESLLQTLNCKPLEVLAGGTEKRPIRSISARIESPLSSLSDNEHSISTPKRSHGLDLVARLMKPSTKSKSLADVSNVPAEVAVKKSNKYWTLPLLKKRPYLRKLMSIDEIDGGEGKGAMPLPSDKVPSWKIEKHLIQAAQSADIKSKPETRTSSPNSPSTTAIATPTKSKTSSNTFKENVKNALPEPPKIVPKTTLMDFKKLLLTTAGKKNYERQSATELLKVAKEPQFPIQNLSYSPRALSNRRTLRQKLPPPVKKPNVMSPRSKWKYKSFDTNFITSIPEATNEEENASLSSQDAIAHVSLDAEPVTANKPAEDEDNYIRQGSTFRNNIFLQEEENNFMRGEVKKFTPIKKAFGIEKTNIDPSVKPINQILTTSKPLAAMTDASKSIDQKPTLETSF